TRAGKSLARSEKTTSRVVAAEASTKTTASNAVLDMRCIAIAGCALRPACLGRPPDQGLLRSQSEPNMSVLHTATRPLKACALPYNGALCPAMNITRRYL